ncbi:PP2C family protein-serine/threonine phosphatase [Actinomadura opuntiae]|uniref:PP2C family protein-serine/threonine phosphatase n=1 Tax=Actinomadura sp. OS1-43 TaxID=604315 RepID=UPI00255B01AB|nr:PP2C family protein-serine/threonine phosphatase [Actinomadura sp. OS1-43]MDL4814438.1 PP2C family protein-serine/threonine phosphatase [Actinomadura sp. OS1-43]
MTRLQDVENALRRTPAHSLPEGLEEALRTSLPAVSDVRLLLADYHLNALVPLDGRDEQTSVRMHGTPMGRAFVSRSTTFSPVRSRAGDRARCEVCVPVTARGERLGVLAVTTDDPASDSLMSDLAEIAEITGCALKVAWNHTDRYERARRLRRLTLAAEIQWQLLPGHGCAGEEFSLAGHLEPAYSIGGDNFDWSTERDHLALTVTNGSGTGIQAALLTSLTVGALRNARRSGADVTEQAALASDMVNARYNGTEFTETLMLRVNLADGVVSAVDAGSPHILLMRGGTAMPVELDHQMPLGMFGDTRYQVQQFKIESGDRLIIVSDGLYTAPASAGGAFGTNALQQAAKRTRGMDAAEVPLAIIGELLEHLGERDLADDAVAVCLDWHQPAIDSASSAHPR